ncbi:MAG TPA: FecR domain-containing protein, partial [Flavisolibacter sp.]|nr:FecR domain-containing protein [Flavisolibacter sp.]
FEVAHNANAPFKVNVNGLQVTVLGTHFNVNAYDDEATVKTTLLEGSVRLTKGSSLAVLKPGQQASVGSNDAIAVRNDVDLDEVIAWKNGSFVFMRQDIKSIMRQISRWYDVEVVYEDEPTKETFSAVMNRQSNVRDVLKIMEENGVKFKIEGRKIIVK